MEIKTAWAAKCLKGLKETGVRAVIVLGLWQC